MTHAGSAAAPAPLIERQDDLERLIERLGKEPLVAVDTEAASFHRHRDRVYLLQLSSRTETAIVDPLAVESLASFGAMLADPSVEIVFHDADYDLRLLDLEYGFRARNLFDTRIAAQLLNEPGIGLAALLEKHLGVKLDKKYQRADWSARPLSPEMLAYAASDTRHLAELRDILQAELERRGRLAWAREEFALLEGTRWNGGDEDEPAYLRMKGAKLLKGRSLAAIRELFTWRDELAGRLDRAAFRIMNNEPMLEVAKALPRDVAALKAIRGLGPDLIERRGREILAAVERAMTLPESALPKVERPPRRAPDLELEARIDRLKAARNALALEARFDLAPGVLCPNGTLEAIARANPQTLEDLAQVSGIRKWQVNAIGKELLAASTAPSAPAPAVTEVRSPGTP